MIGAVDLGDSDRRTGGLPVPELISDALAEYRRTHGAHRFVGPTNRLRCLKALGKPGPGRPAWTALMARMRRKTLIVCAACHDWIHANPVAHAA